MIYTLIMTLRHTSDFNLIILVFNLIIVLFYLILSTFYSKKDISSKLMTYHGDVLFFFIKFSFHLEPEPDVKPGIGIIQCLLVHVF